LIAFPAADRPDVSVVMVTYGAGDLAEEALAALRAGTPAGYEVIVVDNASPDGTGDRLERTVRGATLVRNEVNRGFGPANDQGAARARGRHLVFLNSDAFVTPGWLPPLLETADADPRVGAVCCRLRNPDGSLQEAGGLLYRDGLTELYGEGSRPEREEHLLARDVDYGSAACLLVRRSAFHDAGGFDAAYAPAYYEDVDLCLSLHRKGWRVVYEPRSVAVHVRGASSRDDDARIRAWAASRAVFVERWRDELARRPAPVAKGERSFRREAARDVWAPFRPSP